MMAQFVVVIGEAEASDQHPSFEVGSLHSFVAVEDGRDIDLAQQVVGQQLLRIGFGRVKITDLEVVPAWRRFMPNKQGKELRRLLSSGTNIMVFKDDNRGAKKGT